MAGQLTGHLLPANAPAKVALFTGSLSYRSHEKRKVGFRHILREEFSHIQMLELREITDDLQKAMDETHALFD